MLTLLRQRNFALVWFGGLVSKTGDWMLQVGLPLYVYSLTGSTLATGTMLIAVMAPRLALGSVAGVFVDRWDRRKTLVAANLVLAIALLPLLLVRSADWLWLVYLVALVEASLAQFVRPAEGALLPRLVAEEQLVTANALVALSQNVSRLIGPPLGGLTVGALGLSGVALIDSASFVVAGLLTALVAVNPRPQLSPISLGLSPWAAVWHQWLDGLGVVRRSRLLRVLFAFMALSAIGEGVMGTLFAPFVLAVLGGDELAYGWLVGVQAAGGLVGSVGIARWGRNLPPVRLLGLGAIGLSAIDLLIFNYHLLVPGLTLALVLMAVVGVPVAALQVGAATLLQASTVDVYRGRVLGAIGATGALSTLVGAAIGGLLGDRVGIVAMLNIQSAGYIVAGLTVLRLLSGRGSQTAASLA